MKTKGRTKNALEGLGTTPRRVFAERVRISVYYESLIWRLCKCQTAVFHKPVGEPSDSLNFHINPRKTLIIFVLTNLALIEKKGIIIVSTDNDQASVGNTYHFADSLAYTHGRHTFRGGFEYRRYQINLFNNFASRGTCQRL